MAHANARLGRIFLRCSGYIPSAVIAIAVLLVLGFWFEWGFTNWSPLVAIVVFLGWHYAGSLVGSVLVSDADNATD